MAYIKNLATGITSECNNSDVISICKKDSNFEVLEEKTTSKRGRKKAMDEAEDTEE